jgi:hypothetical protein
LNQQQQREADQKKQLFIILLSGQGVLYSQKAVKLCYQVLYAMLTIVYCCQG